MNTKIIFKFEEGEDASNYVDPLKPLNVIYEITNYLRNLDKHQNFPELTATPEVKAKMDARREMVVEIRDYVRNLCEDIPESYKM